jgi:hypothetical protein
MYIDFDKLAEAGFDVEPHKNGINIYAKDAKSPEALIDLLKDEYNIKPMFAYAMAEDLHEYQILSALKQ